MSQRVNFIRSFPNLFIIGIKWSKTAKTYSHSVKTWRTSQLSLSLALNWKFVIPWLSGETSVTSAFRFSHEGCWVIAWLYELIINTDRARLDSAYGKEVSLSRCNSYQWKQAKWMKDPFFNRSSVIINILTKKFILVEVGCAIPLKYIYWLKRSRNEPKSKQNSDSDKHINNTWPSKYQVISSYLVP